MSFERAAAFAASVRYVLSHFEPLRAFPERCLPADSWLPGHIPAQEASRSALPKRDMSTPISAMTPSEVSLSTPTIVSSSLSFAFAALGELS